MAQPDSDEAFLLRLLLGLVGTVVSAIVGYLLFIWLPDSTTAIGVVLFVATVLVGIQLTMRVLSRIVPSYNVAEVAVEGPITRDGNFGRLPSRRSTPADDVVEQIENADADDAAEALLLKLNTPGGQVVPSDDIRNAAMAFEGPTIAYATDTCASGGYWIASGCDELWARDASIVGSIGVIMSSVNASEFADEMGLSYERLAAGKYKDAGTALKEMTEDDRQYLQGLVDDYYEDFVERVSSGRDMDPEFVQDTEARVYLGDEAHELGLVDELGTRDDVLDHVAELVGHDVFPKEFEPEKGVRERVGVGAQSLAYALGAGLANAVGPVDEFEFRL